MVSAFQVSSANAMLACSTKMTQSKIFRSAALLLLTAATLAAWSGQQARSVDHKVAKATADLDNSSDPELKALFGKFDKLSYSERKKSLAEFQNSNASQTAKQKAAYAYARLLEKGGSADDLKVAIPLYKTASQFAPLWERSLLHTADCANTLGNEPLVRSSLSELEAESKDAKTRARAIYGLAQSYLRANEPDKAETEFLRVIKIGPSTQFATGSKYYLGQIAFLKKNSEEGLQFWREYLTKSPDGRFVREILASTNKDSAELLSPADHKLFADVYFKNGQMAKALEEWSKSQQTPPWYKYATALLRAGRVPEAKAAMMEGIAAHPTDPSVLDAAKLLARRGTKNEAIEVWKYVLEKCPSFGDSALFNLATRATESEALSYYSRLVNEFPESDYAPESSWWVLWDKIKAGTAQPAELQKFASKYENAKSGSRFSYWVGKLEEKQKHKEAAIAAYQNTFQKYGHHYYGYRAQARLQALAGNKDPGWTTKLETNLAHYPRVKNNGGWSWPEPPQLLSYQKIKAESSPTVATLAEIEQWDECLELLPAGKLKELRALCLAKMNLPMEAINTVGPDLRGKPDGNLRWQISYPLLHADQISAEAQVKRVDPFLAQGLIREESRYNVQAISSSNAIGLMQLLPGTAMGVAKRLGVKVSGREDIHKPENNIKFGVDYLSYVLGRHDGNALFAVASYNGGPNAVAKWRTQLPTGDLDYFVESIPFLETRDYVRKVFGSYWNYETIYSRWKG